jgi:hypothetical protein
MKTEVLFQEDNQGQGPLVEEARWSTGWRRIHRPLTVELLDQWIADGVSDILLTYRGFWKPQKLYRDGARPSPTPPSQSK